VIACSPTSTQHVRGSAGMPRHQIGKEQAMLDVILIAVGLGFFALCVIYAFGCERL